MLLLYTPGAIVWSLERTSDRLRLLRYQIYTRMRLDTESVNKSPTVTGTYV